MDTEALLDLEEDPDRQEVGFNAALSNSTYVVFTCYVDLDKGPRTFIALKAELDVPIIESFVMMMLAPDGEVSFGYQKKSIYQSLRRIGIRWVRFTTSEMLLRQIKT